MPHASIVPHAVYGVSVEHVPDACDVELEAMLRADRDRLLACVRLLPVRERFCVVCFYGLYGVEPLSIRTIAGHWDVAPSTMVAAHRRAIALLRAWF